ncbi:type VI secretion system FHA domain protein [Burkholderiales bacterium JOSHI_001]|nr:type VI secretion system FHA domain protein [Burkholderiales bacterium JOSHI_001]
MRLQLVALSCPPPDQPHSIQAQFGEAGGFIGRSRTCTLPLPDPNRHISREHAEVRCRNGEFSLKVVSKLNGAQVNDTLVEPGKAMPLADGDRILIGDYLLQARISAVAAAAPASDDPFNIFASPAPAVGSQWGTLNSFNAPVPPALPSEGPVEDSMPTGKLAEMLGPSAGVPAPMPPASSPDPWSDADISRMFEGLGGTPMPPPAAPSPNMDHVSGGLYRVPDLQQPLGGANPVAEFSPAQGQSEDDIFSVLGELTGAPAVPAPAATRVAPEPLPPVVAPAPAPAAAAAAEAAVAAAASTAAVGSPVPGVVKERRASPRAPAVAATSSDSAALLAILAQSMGLQPGDLDASKPEATMRVVGELLRLSLDGLYRMLEMRSQLKSELRIEDRTMIASRENNPLKHSDSVNDALTYLVDVRQHGNKLFMPPAKAVEDAVWDVCAHEMALMAGTRAALLASLKLFSPDAVEGRIKKSGALDAVLPALHKSKLWERFLEMYTSLEREAEDHFDRLLNQEFAKAYSEQNKKLRKKK